MSLPTDAASSHPRAEYDTARFARLRRRYRRFAFTATAAFLAWFLLYVILSAYARDFMSSTVAGHVNVALVFGLLQFLSTFVIAAAYARYAGARLDPEASAIRDEVES